MTILIKHSTLSIGEHHHELPVTITIVPDHARPLLLVSVACGGLYTMFEVEECVSSEIKKYSLEYLYVDYDIKSKATKEIADYAVKLLLAGWGS